MTKAEVAFRTEASFGSAGTGDWIQPGTDVSVSSVEIDNQLERSRQPDQSTPAGSRPGNVQATADIEFTLTDFRWTDLIPGSGSLDQTGPSPTAEWYFNSDILDSSLAAGQEGVTLAAAAVQSFDVEVEQDGPVSVSLTVNASQLSANDPSAVVQPAVGDEFLGHGAELDVAGVVQVGLQSATISADALAERAEEAGGRGARVYYIGAVEPTLDTTADNTEVDQLELAAGGSSTSLADTLSGPVSATLTVANRSAVTETVEIQGLQPSTFSFDSVADPESLLQESVSYQVTDVGLP
jgi:hypothetical protein